ncbi:hypothetical protein GQ43DRAFT_471392 [Delitschia confertaspora ATCC 74209]|uniref:Uncharacterized protein n=1 Tax=Delitschia confertaspora ATCC 74209 TaxID=1513339 RepID=A0A9P4JRD9_9PLEO|nr:hypothetical protein GQ43DRAFT_471392 [Delitschia confertaspora ATCC 74209]
MSNSPALSTEPPKAPGHTHTPTRPAPVISHPTPPREFDDIFRAAFHKVLSDFTAQGRFMTAPARKNLIEMAYNATDSLYYDGRPLNDGELKQRALTKVMYRIMADEPWTEEWIRPHDVERKLSRFELHPDSVPLALEYGFQTPKQAITAARHWIESDARDRKTGSKKRKTPPPAPFDEIEVIWIPGTVSSTATARINRETIYPISVESVAHVLYSHPCKNITRPWDMAQEWVNTHDTARLVQLRKFACDVCDYAPHLLDNDNPSLLLVLLILTRAEICRRFEDNGIRIEGSTVSHRRSECIKNLLGWKTAEQRKDFDMVASDLQVRVKTAAYPTPRQMRTRRPTKKATSMSQPIIRAADMGITITASAPVVPIYQRQPLHYTKHNANILSPTVSNKPLPAGPSHQVSKPYTSSPYPPTGLQGSFGAEYGPRGIPALGTAASSQPASSKVIEAASKATDNSWKTTDAAPRTTDASPKTSTTACKKTATASKPTTAAPKANATVPKALPATSPIAAAKVTVKSVSAPVHQPSASGWAPINADAVYRTRAFAATRTSIGSEEEEEEEGMGID